MPTVGQPAPDFELPNQDGQPVKLSDFRGKKVILFAYPKADTPGCTTQACGFRDQFPKIEAGNAVVLGISPDEPEDLLKWKRKENLPYDLLSDPEHKVLEAWGVWGEKSMYGKTYFGVIRSHWVIDENGVITDEQIKISPEKSVEKAVNLITL
ncbi:MAG: thioredoxin-dependent thiol peroxidase [Chloroflexi bacterium]|nr:thioredoxin-dependent thiol peroxidase [Chloroflexota bacterium]MDL1882920.1 thioredoxin-dependent thiol peroxidase [Anaerolineae bacterium CFX8]